MPEIVISADTTDTFKRRLDRPKFWMHQDIFYDYKVELTRIGGKIMHTTTLYYNALCTAYCS